MPNGRNVAAVESEEDLPPSVGVIQEEDVGEGPPEEIPNWARPGIPEGMTLPEGAPLTFLRFKSRLCDYRAAGKGLMSTFKRLRVPGKIEDGFEDYEELARILIMWPLSYAEEKAALKRSRDAQTTYDELAKQAIRAVDGMRIDWTGSHVRAENRGSLASANDLWQEIGPRYRPVVIANYKQMSTLSGEELRDFLFDGTVVVRSVAG